MGGGGGVEPRGRENLTITPGLGYVNSSSLVHNSYFYTERPCVVTSPCGHQVSNCSISQQLFYSLHLNQHLVTSL